MRLHRLRLAAFGPFATEQVADFDKLAHGGLFLLEGPTGAGKSTILDAVTFALYGGLAGADAADDRLRSHFAAPDARTEVELEWSLRGVRYKVTRSPEYQRPRKRGDGFTVEASRVHLQRRDGAAWASMSANKAEAGELIAELVGLTRVQFTQVMLLPQGEFARFLRSTDDDRRKLLTRLFGTSLYDRITAELAARRTDATRARDQADRQVADAVSAAAGTAGLDAAERGRLLAAPRADRQTCLKELLESLAQAMAVTGAELEAAAASAVAATQRDAEVARQAGLIARLAATLALLRAHEATRPEHERRMTALAAASRAEPVRPLVAVLTEAEADVAAARDVLAGLIAGPDEDMLAGRGGQEATGRAEAADQAAAALQRLIAAEQARPDAQAALAAAELAAERAQAQVTLLERAKQEVPERVAALDARLSEARVTAAGLAAAQQQLATVNRQRDAAERLAGLRPELEDRAAAVRAAVEEHQCLVDEHQRLMEARLTGMAAELAASLAEGGPCPVCGSPAHPEPALACEAIVSAGEVAQAADRRAVAELARHEAETEHATLAADVAACEARSEGREVASLAAEATALIAQVDEAQAAAGDAGRLELELTDARGAAETVAKDLRDAVGAAAAAQEQADHARAELSRLGAELSAAAAGYPSVAARQAALRQSAAGDRALGKALDRLAAVLDGAAKAAERVRSEALARGFGGPQEVMSAVLAPKRQADLEAQAGSWQEKLATLTSMAQAPELAGLDPTQAEQVRASAAEAAAALAQAQDAERAARDAHEQAKRTAARFGQLCDEVQAAEDGYDRAAEETEAVIHLAGLANGTDGQRRVALTTYVLRHWFGQVVAAANVRLSAMSSGRYELRRTDEGRTRRDRSGLTLAVIDRHTGEERSPASLSGGETFYTSLALALGLADTVRAEAGGVDLDTLFIDEGFGSLDSGTLDQVMGVIDDLRDRGRVIGIVSHVAELKERVPERLEVRHRPDGSSAVRVVA
jgi:DNA repair protein SbcC/Rad50